MMKVQGKLLAATSAVVLGIAGSAGADSVTGLFNTGVDASGAVLPYGSSDPHYLITSPVAAPELTMDSSGGFPIPPWVGDDLVSRWDSQQQKFPTSVNGQESKTLYDNVTTFMSPFAGTVTIKGQWAADDIGPNILIDGVGTGAATVTPDGYSTWTPFSISGHVHAGSNTLDFQNDNFGGGAGGVRVEFTSANVVPTPSAALGGISVLGLMGAVVLRKRLTRSQA